MSAPLPCEFLRGVRGGSPPFGVLLSLCCLTPRSGDVSVTVVPVSLAVMALESVSVSVSVSLRFKLGALYRYRTVRFYPDFYFVNDQQHPRLVLP